MPHVLRQAYPCSRRLTVLGAAVLGALVVGSTLTACRMDRDAPGVSGTPEPAFGVLGGSCDPDRVSALVKAAFETLVDAGYQPEIAYFECMHELKLIVDLFYQGGLGYMRYSVSDTAEYGDYTRGPRIVTEQTEAEMKKILHKIQSGQFAREWILENKANAPAFKATRRREREHPIEVVGKQLRRLMSWIKAKEV